VNGLQLKHVAVHGSWAADANQHWRALGDVLGPEVPISPTSKTVPKKKERKATEETTAPALDADWPLLSVVQGKSALIIGGDPREPSRQRLEAYLQLDSLDWPAVDGPRKVEAVAQRISKGAYDLVLVLQPFVAHHQADRIVDAAKETKTPWALVEGYGAASVRQGIERFLRPHVR
jgi:hypothetical protein